LRPGKEPRNLPDKTHKVFNNATKTSLDLLSYPLKFSPGDRSGGHSHCIGYLGRLHRFTTRDMSQSQIRECRPPVQCWYLPQASMSHHGFAVFRRSKCLPVIPGSCTDQAPPLLISRYWLGEVHRRPSGIIGEECRLGWHNNSEFYLFSGQPTGSFSISVICRYPRHACGVMPIAVSESRIT